MFGSYIRTKHTMLISNIPIFGSFPFLSISLIFFITFFILIFMQLKKEETKL